MSGTVDAVNAGRVRAPATPTALKEWAVVCDLLLAGRMTVLFRKGGIDEKGFWVEADRFLLFPTYFHQNRDKVRDEFLAAFDAAMEAGPPAGTLRVPGYAEVVEAIEVRRPDRIGELEDLHPYTREQIDMRLEFRPKKPLVLLAVQTFALEEPIEAPMLDAYGGCSSWVPLQDVGAADGRGRAVLERDEVVRIAERVRGTVG